VSGFFGAKKLFGAILLAVKVMQVADCFISDAVTLPLFLSLKYFDDERSRYVQLW